ncbi:MAG TPA: hypothetical protein PKD03_05670 [Ignavibacteriaceae bacterium]|nr:hypothetical protein [Ignavibacteriaceae bacterium]
MKSACEVIFEKIGGFIGEKIDGRNGQKVGGKIGKEIGKAIEGIIIAENKKSNKK